MPVNRYINALNDMEMERPYTPKTRHRGTVEPCELPTFEVFEACTGGQKSIGRSHDGKLSHIALLRSIEHANE